MFRSKKFFLLALVFTFLIELVVQGFEWEGFVLMFVVSLFGGLGVMRERSDRGKI